MSGFSSGISYHLDLVDLPCGGGLLIRSWHLLQARPLWASRTGPEAFRPALKPSPTEPARSSVPLEPQTGRLLQELF